MAAFERFEDRLSAVADDASRRALLAEISLWRARHLTDVPALRDAAWAMSRLYQAIGRHADAVREAEALLSLCQTAPEATGEESEQTAAWLRSLGVSASAPAPRAAPARKDRRDRPERPAREPSGGGDDVASLARSGRFEEAFARLRGRKGPRADLTRAWVAVLDALASKGDAQRRKLEVLASRLDPEAEAHERPAPPEEPTGDDPLAKLLGRPVPKNRGARVEALEGFASENPERVDELASLALERHVAVEGLKAPAPWLVGFVARALATGRALRTRRVLDELAARGAYAVTAYGERAFDVVVDVASSASSAGWDVNAVRRGVLSKSEPHDKKLWTVRLVKDFVERMLVVGTDEGAPYDPDTAAQLAGRLLQLCSIVVLHAPGASNAALREAVGRIGIQVVDSPNPAAILQALEGGTPAPGAGEAPPPRARGREPQPREAAEGAPAERAPRPDREPREELVAAFTGGAGEDELAALLGRFRRVHRGFGLLDAQLAEAAPDRVVALLRGAHKAAPEKARLPEGVTALVRTASRHGRDAVAEVLGDEGLRARFGGPGLDDVIALARALSAAGWSIERALRGPTGRERRDDPVIAALGDTADGLWRLVVRRGDVTGEVWFVAELPPEGRAIVPRLLLAEGQRVVVLPIEGGLSSWYASAGGPAPIGWTGAEGADVAAELDAWVPGGALPVEEPAG